MAKASFSLSLIRLKAKASCLKSHMSKDLAKAPFG